MGKESGAHVLRFCGGGGFNRVGTELFLWASTCRAMVDIILLFLLSFPQSSLLHRRSFGQVRQRSQPPRSPWAPSCPSSSSLRCSSSPGHIMLLPGIVHRLSTASAASLSHGTEERAAGAAAHQFPPPPSAEAAAQEQEASKV